MAAPACADTDDDAVAIVAVAARACDRPNRDIGVGVVIAPDIVATAAHTVDGSLRELTVDGIPAQVVAIDARTDLALLTADLAGVPAATTFDDIDRGTVLTPDGDHDVDVLQTGRLVVDDTTDGTRHERSVHTFTPGVDAGTSGAPLVDEAGRVAGIVVLTNRTDGTAYAVTVGEVLALLERERLPAAPVGCPG